MANKKWFTMKHHGWGWVPVTWEGWVVTMGLIAWIYFISRNYMGDSFWLLLIASIMGFYFIVTKKGPMPRWRWDKK